jgi:hypothetical protein
MTSPEDCSHCKDEVSNLVKIMDPDRGMSVPEIRALFPLRHQDTLHILQFFADNHFPKELWPMTALIRVTAFSIVEDIKDGPELTVALRKMLSSRDAFVRHYQTIHNFKVED